MEKRNDKANDVSSFFLFEVTGDSEDSNVNVSRETLNVELSDDDAGSCSCACDSSSDSHLGIGDELLKKEYCDVVVHDQVNFQDDDHDHDDGEEEEGEEARSYTVLPNKNKQIIASLQKSTIDNKELKKQMEDRLFWESCFAS